MSGGGGRERPGDRERAHDRLPRSAGGELGDRPLCRLERRDPLPPERSSRREQEPRSLPVGMSQRVRGCIERRPVSDLGSRIHRAAEPSGRGRWVIDDRASSPARPRELARAVRPVDRSRAAHPAARGNGLRFRGTGSLARLLARAGFRDRGAAGMASRCARRSGGLHVAGSARGRRYSQRSTIRRCRESIPALEARAGPRHDCHLASGSLARPARRRFGAVSPLRSAVGGGVRCRSRAREPPPEVGLQQSGSPLDRTHGPRRVRRPRLRLPAGRGRHGPGIVSLARVASHTASGVDVYWAFMLAPVVGHAVTLHELRISSPEPDTMMALVAMAAGGEFVRLASHPERSGAFAAAVLAVLAACLKLTAAPYALVLVALVLARGAPIRAITVAGTGLVVPWILRGLVLTGYPLYPLSIAGAPVDWRVPRELVDRLRMLISAHFMPPIAWELAAGGPWVKGWFLWQLTRCPELILLPALGLAVIAPFVRAHRVLLLLVPCAASLLVWLSAPAPRFGYAFAWIAAATMSVALFEKCATSTRAPRRLALIALICVAAVPIVHRVLAWAVSVEMGTSSGHARIDAFSQRSRVSSDAGVRIGQSKDSRGVDCFHAAQRRSGMGCAAALVTGPRPRLGAPQADQVGGGVHDPEVMRPGLEPE